MVNGFLVRVTTARTSHNEPLMAFWIVATDEPDEAIRIVRTMVPTALEVEISKVPVRPRTVEQLGLSPGQAFKV